MNKFLAEAIGTFALVFIGTGAIIVNDVTGGMVTHVGISLAFGMVVLVMIYSIGNISGAHLNPAVTLSFWFAGRMPANEIFPYIISQFVGALIASGLLVIIFPEHGTLGTTLPSGSVTQSLVLEITLGFLLMFVVLNVSSGAMEKGIMAGVAVGSMIAMGALFAGPISGASMNPARSLAPALMSGHLEHLWIYFLGPIAGTLLASPMCSWIQGAECCDVLQNVRGKESSIKQGDNK
jgi:MIP family channel proteins